MDKGQYAWVIERVEQVRVHLGLNKSQFCESFQMMPQTYNNFVGAQGTKPNIELLAGVVNTFGVEPMWFLDQSTPKPTPLCSKMPSIFFRSVMEMLDGNINCSEQEVTVLLNRLEVYRIQHFVDVPETLVTPGDGE